VSLEKDIADFDAAANTFDDVVHNLQSALTLLTDAQTIGVWVSSDDSSDNREKRRKLRDALIEISYATAHLERETIANVDVTAAMTALRRQLDAAHNNLQPLPGQISDTMARDDYSVDGEVSRIEDTLTEAMERAKELATECRAKSARRREMTSG